MERFDVYPSEKRTQFTRVQDDAGNAYICSVDELKNPKKATRRELKKFCIDESKSPQPFAGG